MSGPSGPGRLPPHAPGMRIGLYGGSFDPPHSGHRHVASTALKRLRLDRVWWIVIPGNPLKGHVPHGSRSERATATERIASHPRMDVLGAETGIAAVYTVDMIRRLRRRCPGISFVWIMGADSLAGFHRWRAWREIAGLLPIAVIDRPGWTLRAPRSRAATRLAGFRVPERSAARLASTCPPAWTFLHGPRSSMSSTALRPSRPRSAGGRLAQGGAVQAPPTRNR